MVTNNASNTATGATNTVLTGQGVGTAPTFGTVNVASGGTGVTSTTAYAVLCGGTTSTNPLQSIASVGTSGQVLTSNGAGALPTFQAAGVSSVVVQQVRATTNSVVTCSTQIPFDDTIPQNTEGTEVLTVTITPTNANNKLLIEFTGTGTISGAGGTGTALFQDSTANALAGTVTRTATGVSTYTLLRHTMTAGTTSATTFKIRCGQDQATTYYINGQSGGTRFYGGVASTVLTVTEYTS